MNGEMGQGQGWGILEAITSKKRDQICLPILLIKKRAFVRGVEGEGQRVGVGKERGYGAESTVYVVPTMYNGR